MSGQRTTSTDSKAPQSHQQQATEDQQVVQETDSAPKLYTSISFLKKRPDITHEQFYHHWEKVHGPLAVPWMKRHGFRSYTQYHSLPSLNAAGIFAPIGPENPNGQNADILREYDGAAVVEVDTLEAFQKAFEDEYYRNVIAEDEKLFLDKSAGVLRTRAEAKKILRFEL